MKLLSLDTATEACSAALYIDGEVSEQYQIAPQRHAELILPMAEELLAEAELSLAQLDAIAFGRGPGSFTGVRIAAGVVQGIAFAADLPVVPVSSLAALAQGAADASAGNAILAVIDARMHEVYWSAYAVAEYGQVSAIADEQVCAVGAIVLPAREQWLGVGSGWSSYPDELRQLSGLDNISIEHDRFPRARDIARLGVTAFEHGEAVAAEFAIPVYLRDNVAKKKHQQVR
ncbi:MAG: tRNA (adenosine(37)-N6)-threonylcarbamoyltransferase complex dimerization subunit type 1 TsaB [Gammaproteobacteria bacterium]|nr:MAG: tRNA (adenosine(37)-N6)-threonylcarbamoyltransferase complex dimerization subunit type 1 TsaB [Gammaproteobacteria bacterium]